MPRGLVLALPPCAIMWTYCWYCLRRLGVQYLPCARLSFHRRHISSLYVDRSVSFTPALILRFNPEIMISRGARTVDDTSRNGKRMSGRTIVIFLCVMLLNLAVLPRAVLPTLPATMFTPRVSPFTLQEYITRRSLCA